MHALKYWRRVSKLIDSYTDKITSRITFSRTGTPRKKHDVFLQCYTKHKLNI